MALPVPLVPTVHLWKSLVAWRMPLRCRAV
jgi:hypothetical protein